MAKYEVHIPAATPGVPSVTLRVFADNWMAALKTGMEKVGEQGSQMSNILCDILEDGAVDVTDPKTGRVFRIHELEGSDEPTPVSGAYMAPVRSELDDREEKTDPELSLPDWGEKSAPSPVPLNDAVGARTRTTETPPPPAAKPSPPRKLEVVDDDEPTPKPEAGSAEAPPPARSPAPRPQPAPAAARPPPAKAPPGASPPRTGVPTQVARSPSKPRLVEQIEEPSVPIRGPIGRNTGKRYVDPEEVFAELFERVQEAESMDRPKALYFFLDLAMQKIPAESGSVLLAPLGSGELRFAAARGPKSQELLKLNPRVPMGKGIAGFCTQESVAVAISDAQRDKRFLRQISERVGYDTRSMICAPMTSSGKTYGCLEVINRHGGHQFQDSELAILSYVAHQVGKYIESHGGA